MKLQSPNPRTFRQFRLLILSYFKVLSALDFLVFWLMISITASDTKTRPPIFQQVLGKSLEQGKSDGNGDGAARRRGKQCVHHKSSFFMHCARQSRQLASFTDFTWSRLENFSPSSSLSPSLCILCF